MNLGEIYKLGETEHGISFYYKSPSSIKPAVADLSIIELSHAVDYLNMIDDVKTRAEKYEELCKKTKIFFFNRLNVPVELHRQLKDSDEISFVAPTQKADETLQLKFDIVKHVIVVRMAENEAAATVRANRERKQSLLALIAQKENEQLAGKSLDDLKAMVDSL